MERSVKLPHTVVRINQSRASLPFLNFSFSVQSLPKGVTLGVLSSLGEYDLSILTADPQKHPANDFPSATTATEPYSTMLAPDLLPVQHDALRHLLASYWDIFDSTIALLVKLSRSRIELIQEAQAPFTNARTEFPALRGK